MGVVLHWFLPTNGDSRTDLSLGNAVGAAGSRVSAGGTERPPDVGYMGQIARSAEQLGFAGALTPTSSWCEDAWLMTAALTQVTVFSGEPIFSYQARMPFQIDCASSAHTARASSPPATSMRSATRSRGSRSSTRC